MGVLGNGQREEAEGKEDRRAKIKSYMQSEREKTGWIRILCAYSVQLLGTQTCSEREMCHKGVSSSAHFPLVFFVNVCPAWP